MAKKSKGSIWRKAVSADTDRQKKQASKTGYFQLPKNVKLFKETPGTKVKMDFLPYIVTDENHPDRNAEFGIAVPGAQWYKRPFRIHRGIGVNNEYVVCPTSIGKKCPICEQRAKLQKQGNASKEELQALNATNRVLYIVIPFGQKDYEEVPHIWDMSQFLFQEKLNEEIEEEDDHADFPSLEDGKTLRIRFVEESYLKNKYASVGRIDFLERDEPYGEDMLAKVPNLDEVLIVLSYAELDKKFMDMEDVSDDDDSDDDDTPVRKPSKAPRQLEEDDDDDEEEKPKSKMKQAKRPKVEEDEEESEDDDDDTDDDSDDDDSEDEETVKPKAKAKPAPVPAPKAKKKPVEEDEDEEDEEEEEVKPKAKPKKKPVEDDEDEDEVKPKAKSKKNKCPHGHTFGDDCESFPDDCEECVVWSDCLTASNE